MNARRSPWALPAAAVALVAVVLSVQVASGGGAFAPTPVASACAHRDVVSASSGIDGLTERLVLIGLDRAACRLGTTREALVLELARTRTPTDRQLAALRAGLLEAVDRMNADGTLPKASALTDDALGRSDLNFLLKAAIRALPDGLIDGALKTDDVLRRTIRQLDLRRLFADLDNRHDLDKQINDAVTKAVKDSLVARLRDLP